MAGLGTSPPKSPDAFDYEIVCRGLPEFHFSRGLVTKRLLRGMRHQCQVVIQAGLTARGGLAQMGAGMGLAVFAIGEIVEHHVGQFIVVDWGVFDGLAVLDDGDAVIVHAVFDVIHIV